MEGKFCLKRIKGVIPKSFIWQDVHSEAHVLHMNNI